MATARLAFTDRVDELLTARALTVQYSSMYSKYGRVQQEDRQKGSRTNLHAGRLV